jgi:hypothetical protein
MRISRSVVMLVLVIAGCSSEPKKSGIDRDTLTQRQKDSLLGTTKIPGASNIPKAQRAADSLSARARALDTIR